MQIKQNNNTGVYYNVYYEDDDSYLYKEHQYNTDEYDSDENLDYLNDYPNYSYETDTIDTYDSDIDCLSDEEYDYESDFSDDEFNNLDKRKSFTTAILLFNNNEFMHNIIKTNLKMMKEFQSKSSRIAPPCFDQPVTNKICIHSNTSNNTTLSKYCLNVMGSDTIDKINQINSYIICHFATSVGHSESKLQRMRYSLEKITS